MLEEIDAFDFVLAEKLSMTVDELHDRMTNSEFLKWRAFYTYKAAMLDLETKKGSVAGASRDES